MNEELATLEVFLTDMILSSKNKKMDEVLSKIYLNHANVPSQNRNTRL